MKERSKKISVKMPGFTLLEVMVALAILSLSFTSLILVQSRATRLALETRNLSIATQLARFRLMECKREVRKVIGSLSDFKEEGDFTEEGFPDIRWECHAPKFNMKTPSASKIEENLKEKKNDGPKKETGASSSVSAPFIGMITDTLNTAVRELAVIVRWTNNSSPEEIRVVTHVVDLAPMAALSRLLKEGAKTFEKAFSKNNDKSKPPQKPSPEVP